MPEAYESMRGEKNPMRRPEVVAKQAESLRKTWADPQRRKQMLAHKDRLAEFKQQRREEVAARSRKWSDERKQAHSDRMKGYWAKVRAALAVVGE